MAFVICSACFRDVTRAQSRSRRTTDEPILRCKTRRRSAPTLVPEANDKPDFGAEQAVKGPADLYRYTKEAAFQY